MKTDGGNGNRAPLILSPDIDGDNDQTHGQVNLPSGIQSPYPLNRGVGG